MEKTSVKLSIIVPVYNVRPYIEKCIGSLLAQRLEDYEIILIDDGSTDGTAQILDGYAENFPEKVIVRHVENGGQGRARNIALDIARGEWLGFIDSDDWISPDMYPKLLERAQESGADIAVCDFLAVYQDGGEELLPACLQEHPLSSAGSACNKIFRRELVEDLRFPQGLWYEDFYYSAMALIRSKKTVFLPEALYMYRRGQESTMKNQNSAKNLDMLKIMELLRAQMEGRGEDFQFLVLNHVLLDSISRVARQETPDRDRVLRELRSYVKAQIPSLSRSEPYKKESGKRRVIMALNYHGLWDLALKLLDINSRLRGS